MNKVYCMRGLPGSGKDTHIRSVSAWDKIIICSADDYFMINGEYHFDPTKLAAAHTACLRKFLQALTDNVETIVINNTNVCAWEIAPYAALSAAMGYDFCIVEMECTVEQSIARNSHGVSPETVGAMAEAMKREILPPFWKKHIAITPSLNTN